MHMENEGVGSPYGKPNRYYSVRERLVFTPAFSTPAFSAPSSSLLIVCMYLGKACEKLCKKIMFEKRHTIFVKLNCTFCDITLLVCCRQQPMLMLFPQHEAASTACC